MSIVDVLFPSGLPANIADFGIIMSAEQAAELVRRQDAAQLHRLRVAPVALTDGRFAVRADVLTEAGAGGLFAGHELVVEEDLAGIVIVPWAEVLALLPVAELEGEL